MKTLTEKSARAITYSVLSHIRSKGTLYNDTIEIFIPLVKRTLGVLCDNGLYSGDSVFEIQAVSKKMYGIEFPIPTIKLILHKISDEINTEQKKKIVIHKDNSFIIDRYEFSELEDEFAQQQVKIIDLENYFKQFCKIKGESTLKSESIFDFIESNKVELGRYLGSKKIPKTELNIIHAEFVRFFKPIPEVYDTIKGIYLGSLIATCIEYEIKEISFELELVFDTNFIVSLLDLNTAESTHTCRKLVELAIKSGFKCRVLWETLQETESLLRHKIDEFDSHILVARSNPEDILNACERRGMSKSDLENIAIRLEEKLNSFGVITIQRQIYLAQKAQSSPEFQKLKRYRNSEKAALHDAIAVHYVRQRRNSQTIYQFEKSVSWFVNNSYSVNTTEGLKNNALPEIIKADDLLNILWLSNPEVKKTITEDDIGDVGIAGTIALTFAQSMPKSALIRELDDNIYRYRGEDINDDDVFRLGTRIAQRKVQDDDEIFKIDPAIDRQRFIERAKEIVRVQKADDDNSLKQLDHLITSLSQGREKLKKKHTDADMLQAKIIEEGKNAEARVEATREKILSERISEKVKSWKFTGTIISGVFWAVLVVIFVYDLHVLDYNWSIICAQFIEIKGNEIKWAIYGLVLALNISITKIFLVNRCFSPKEEKNYRELLRDSMKEW